MSQENKLKKENLYNKMVKSKIFQKRLYSLRKFVYGISCQELEVMTENLVSRSAVNNWEKGERLPYFDGMQIIASCFGVSMDWLCGISNIPYTEESVNNAKNIYLNDGEKTYRNYTINKKSLDMYNLEVQANIIVLLRYKEFAFSNPKIHNYKYQLEYLLLDALEKNFPVCKIPEILKSDITE